MTDTLVLEGINSEDLDSINLSDKAEQISESEAIISNDDMKFIDDQSWET